MTADALLAASAAGPTADALLAASAAGPTADALLAASAAGQTPPVELYAAALRRAHRGGDSSLHLLDLAGRAIRRLDASWYARLRPGDAGLVRRCPGATVDLGCGPGRLASELLAQGRPTLGVDISAQAVRYARRRGVPTLHRDVFDRLPGEGRWRIALLADGNIGIGGDPVRLLLRCRRLVAADGAVLIEVDPPGTSSWRGQVRLVGSGRASSPFAWAFVSADDIGRYAERAALRLVESWTDADRWFARLIPTR